MVMSGAHDRAAPTITTALQFVAYLRLGLGWRIKVQHIRAGERTRVASLETTIEPIATHCDQERAGCEA